MHQKLSRYSDGQAWRVFTTDFYLFPCTVTHEDYIKFCDIIDKIFKNVFNIDYSVSNHVTHEEFNYLKAIFNHTMTYENPKKRKNLNFCFADKTYLIDFSFTFVEVEKFYVFESCCFSVTDKNLAVKLPIDPKNKKDISCVCHFKEDQQYNGVVISYSQMVDHPKLNWVVFTGCPNLIYKHTITTDSRHLEIEYEYKEFSEVLSKSSDKYFSFKMKNITPAISLRVEQLYKLINYYSAGVDVSSYFPDLKAELLDSSKLVRYFLEDFFELHDDISDLLLLFDMETI